MLCDALQDVDQVRVDVDLVQSTGHDQRLDDADVLGAELCPAEVPVLAPHGDYSQCALEVIRIERHVWVAQEHFEPGSSLACVMQCGDERGLRAQAVRLELSVHPVEERLDSKRLSAYRLAA